MVDYTEEELKRLQSPLPLGEDRPDEVVDGGEGDSGIPLPPLNPSPITTIRRRVRLGGGTTAAATPVRSSPCNSVFSTKSKKLG
jgi:hypothetical protein